MKRANIVNEKITKSQKKLIISQLNKKKKKKFKYSKKHYTKRVTKKFIKYSLIVSIFYLLILYLMFFVFHINEQEKYNTFNKPIINDILEIKLISNLTTYLDTDSKKPLQPINIIFITKSKPEILFDKINWEQNEMFSTDKITIKNYYYLYKNKSLPISENYLNNQIQDFAFQEISNSNLDREHIRLWDIGYYKNTENNIYLASISYDTGIKFSVYRDFLVPLHKFDPNVDKSRNYLLEQFIKLNPPKKYYNLSFENKIINLNSSKQKYFTDGNIIVLEFD